ncbi:MAG: hypothetical protein MZV70_12030 [Desulfobacterales bacterium]|nr:hypothetical protein [Desulfobacterales bacterium]
MHCGTLEPGNQPPMTAKREKEATMGLFDFVKEIGHKLFNRDEEAAEKIKKHIEASNPGIERPAG